MFSVDVSRGNQRGAPGTIPFLGIIHPHEEFPAEKYKSDFPLSDSDKCRSQLIIFCGEFLIGVYKSKEWDGTWRPPSVAPADIHTKHRET